MPRMVAGDAPEHSRLGELYARCWPSGIRLGFLLTGDQALAEDLVQEAFVRMVGAFKHMRHPEAADVYLRRTIINLSRSYFRRRRVERVYLERIEREPKPLTNSNDDLDESVHLTLLQLPERQRAALVLRFFEDLSDSQTAEIMRCSAGTVRSLVSRGMKTLRVELGEVTR